MLTKRVEKHGSLVAILDRALDANGSKIFVPSRGIDQRSG